MSDTAPMRRKWTEEGYVDVVFSGCEDFEEIAELGGAEYEWDQLTIFYSPSRRRYFWIEQIGCSCDMPWQYVDSIEDFESGIYADAKKQVLDFKSAFWLYGEGETQKNNALSNLRKHKTKLIREAPRFI